MLEPTLLAAAAAVLFLLPFDLLIGGYLLLAVNLEAYRCGTAEWSLSVEAVVTAVVACRTLIEWFLDPRMKGALLEGRWFVRALALFLAVAALSALFSIEPARSWKALARYSTYPVLAMAIVRTGQRRGPRWVRNVCVASAVLPCLCALAQVYRPDLMFGQRAWKPDTIAASVGALTVIIPRVNGTLNSANALAMYLLVIAGWGLSSSPALSGRRRPGALLLGAALSSMMVFLTFCRAAWICALLLLVAWAALNARLRVILCTVLSIGIVITGAVQSGMVEQRFADIRSPNNSLTWRLMVWRGVVDRPMDTQRVVIGYGLDTMIIDNEAQQGFKAHSAFVAAYHDCGVAGLIAFVLLILAIVAEPLKVLRTYWANKRLRALNSFALLTVAGFVFLSITEEPFAVPTVALYFWTALLTCHLESTVSRRAALRLIRNERIVYPQQPAHAYDARCV